MKSVQGIGLKDVQKVYGGVEGDLWELIMGEQVHIGGFASSMDLATRAGIGDGMSGVDFCCCNGAGMRFLAKFKGVKSMTGVDATEKVIKQGVERTKNLGLADKISFIKADVTSSGLPSGTFDFAWGEDAWCYVEDKSALIREATRVVKPGGLITFTDWVEGPGMTDAEADRYMTFMKFPNVLSIADYNGLLEKNGCVVKEASNTGRFAPCVDLYLDMLNKQLTYDALRIIGFDMNLMQALGGEMVFMQGLAHEGKIIQGCFVARKE
ncbi:MAG: class I SAM-dependent methyltransferase [Kiritimatiellae bacterium]|nr:class I SAM-dependent methyltransferase [Kiritimatiellia bacterium]MDD5520944.1 class I SAM-dependent methyltransferase [Kiritimatiellia bacterium]